MTEWLAATVGTILVTMLGWLMMSVKRAHTRIDDLREKVATKDDLKEVKADFRDDLMEIKGDLKEIRRYLEKMNS